MNVVETMNQRHAQYSQALLGLFSAGMQTFNRQFQTQREGGQTPSLALSVKEMTRLLEVAQRTERLARGQATSRTEVMVELIGTFVREFALIFIGVNSIQDETERKNEYVRRCDEMLHDIYPKGDSKLLS